MLNERCLGLIGGMCEQYNRAATEALFMVYDVGLDDLPIKQVELAIIQAMRQNKFMPTVAEIRELVQGRPGDIAEQAFKTLSDNISAYQTLKFEDTRIPATVRHLGGMIRLCDMAEDGEEFNVWYRKEFLRVYATYQRRGVGEEEGLALVGIYGHPAEEVDLIPAPYDVPALMAPSQTLLGKP